MSESTSSSQSQTGDHDLSLEEAYGTQFRHPDEILAEMRTLSGGVTPEGVTLEALLTEVIADIADSYRSAIESEKQIDILTRHRIHQTVIDYATNYYGEQ